MTPDLLKKFLSNPPSKTGTDTYYRVGIPMYLDKSMVETIKVVAETLLGEGGSDATEVFGEKAKDHLEGILTACVLTLEESKTNTRWQ